MKNCLFSPSSRKSWDKIFKFEQLIEFTTKDYEQRFIVSKERQLKKFETLFTEAVTSAYNQDTLNSPYTIPKSIRRKDNVINLSNYIPTQNELEILSLWLNFALPPSVNLIKNLKLKFISSIESHFKDEDIEEIQIEIIRRDVCKLVENGQISKPNNEILKT